jgi:cold shock CspA family protein
MTGTILQWNAERGFGFVQGSNGRNYFGHISKWDDEKPPVEGGVVEFTIRQTRPGKRPECIGMKYVQSDAGVEALQAAVRTTTPESGTDVLVTKAGI